MPNEKDDKANKNNGVDSRKNLKKNPTVSHRHTPEAFISQTGVGVGPYKHEK